MQSQWMQLLHIYSIRGQQNKIISREDISSSHLRCQDTISLNLDKTVKKKKGQKLGPDVIRDIWFYEISFKYWKTWRFHIQGTEPWASSATVNAYSFLSQSQLCIINQLFFFEKKQNSSLSGTFVRRIVFMFSGVVALLGAMEYCALHLFTQILV